MAASDMEERKTRHGQADDPLDTVFTWANLVTLIRFLLIPLYIYFLVAGFPQVYAFVTFALAGCTDWIDGRLARRTNTVSKFGKLFDPFIDRLLIVTGVLSVFALGRVPIWVACVLIVRDAFLIGGAIYLKLQTGTVGVPVAFIGKCTTASLLVGFASLLIGWPTVPGLGIIDSAYLPGLGSGSAVLGILFIYIGCVLSITTAAIYVRKGWVTYRSFLDQGNAGSHDSVTGSR